MTKTPTTGRKSLLKDLYKARITNLIFENTYLSRTDIQSLTGMRPATITNLVKELIQDGVVREHSVAKKNPYQKGRKRILLELNPQGGYVMGVEIQPRLITGILVNLKNEVVFERTLSLPDRSHASVLLGYLKELIQCILSDSPVEHNRIMGIGIADPGLVERNQGISLLSTQIEDWHNIPTRQIIADAFNLPTYLEGNTNCKLRAEIAQGSGETVRNILFLDLSGGVGASIVSQGTFYYGSRGLAGEIGHVQVQENGPMCSCGSRGCLETLASSRAVLDKVKEALASDVFSPYLERIKKQEIPLTLETFVQAAREGDKLCIGIAEETGRILGKVIADTVNLLNPETVILGGELSCLQELLLNPVRGTVKRQALELVSRELRFEIARVQKNAAALGAALFILQEIFRPPELANPPAFQAGIPAQAQP